jgi:hypothetical protein
MRAWPLVRVRVVLIVVATGARLRILKRVMTVIVNREMAVLTGVYWKGRASVTLPLLSVETG